MRLRRWLHKPSTDQIDKLAGCIEAIYHTQADRKRRGAVAVEFSERLVRQMADDWSPPVRLKFVQLPDGEWTMEVRNAVHEVHEKLVAERASRQ
jgi:hypothetical protein